MRNASANYITAINQDTRTFFARFLYNGIPVSGDIKQITLTQGATFDGVFAPGAVFSPYIDVTIDNCVEGLQGKELKLEMGLLVDGSVEYLSMGYYTVGAPKTRRNTSNFIANGRITSKMTEGYFSGLSYPATISSVLAEISSQSGIGISLIGGLSGTGLIEQMPKGYLHREMLGYIAGLLGGFATEDTNGGIVIAPFPTIPDYTLTGDRYYDFPEVNDLDYTCTGIKVVVSSGFEDEEGESVSEVAYSHGTPNILVNNPFMTQAMFDVMYPKVEGYSYRPGTVTFLGDNRLEPWDLLAVIDGENTFSIPAFGITQQFDGGLITGITSPGTTDTDASTESKGPVAQQIERIYTDLLFVQDALVNRLKVEEAEITYATIQNLVAATARIGTLEANQIDVSYLDAHFAKIDLANVTEISAAILKAHVIEAINASIEEATIGSAKIDVAEISSLVAGSIDAEFITSKIATVDNGFLNAVIANQGVIKTAQIAEAAITNALIADLSANKINAGTLSVERLLIGGAEGGLLFALNNYGELVSTAVDSLDGAVLTPRTITADRIVAESITAEEIAAESILANHIVSGAITADKLAVSCIDVGGLLNAVEGVIGAFTIGDAYIAKGTSVFGTINEGETGSVYIGANGISCGDKFKVDSQGNITATGLSLNMFDSDSADWLSGVDSSVAFQSGLSQYLSFSADDGLILGTSGDGPKLQLLGTRLSLLDDDGNAGAYLENPTGESGDSKLYIDNAVILSSLGFGNGAFAFENRDNGNVSLVCKG